MLGSLLIVDDESIVRQGLRRLIESQPLNWQIVGEAEDGWEAIELIGQLKPDLVITDIRMPGMDGIQLAEQIYSKQYQTAVIILTAYREFDYAQSALRYGVIDFLLKPCPAEEIGRVLQRAYTKVLSDKKIEDIAKITSQLPGKGSLITQALQFIEEHYMEDCPVTKAAACVHVTPNYFSNIFKRETGENFTNYLTKVRVEKAKLLLKKTDLRITDIALGVGFENSNYFTTVFKQMMGISPTEFRKIQSAVGKGE